MPEYKAHMYMVCYPTEALLLSHLGPGQFAHRYCYGTGNYYAGKMIFAKIDIDYRNDFFLIDECLKELKPHEDGSPKASKYVANYRVLEHVDLDAIQSLYLVNPDGTYFELKEGEFVPDPNPPEFYLYTEVTPLSMMTLSCYDMRTFGRYFTGLNPYLSVPRLMYLRQKLDVEEFLEQFAKNPFAPSPIEGVHPAKLRDSILELKSRKNKLQKGLTLDTNLSRQSFRSIEGGIMFIDSEKEKFFPIPDHEIIEKADLRFFKSM